MDSTHYIAVTALLVVTGIVILSKRLLYRYIRVRGGMPSGHAAFAFSCWIISVFLTKDTFVGALVLMLAILIARSRIQSKAHTFWEVFVGAALGIFVTAAIFQFLT